ncbi:uroporphyrinogen-III C-methyltransferase [Halalkalibacter akibai]|uniref:Uroporphyrinogen-III C-methyltransferase n=1 Tax=Halalkalibacter akibai (strain ATCC 43226 / DSM 21942 / CIP 109018 / JCM 9157 / 1139) TaxID=1236973 RepID=W4QNP5_HALA3|nr:uroporphyrinogen-III C-methyltransferase [Halalkalibacter akibai]GAE33517.1 uroporphyrinogen-III methyltransferase [Halalkalibacter akibai JCM 9157]
MKKGYVYLVGAGPGDIRLLTVKGEQCLESADVVLYDRLVNPLLLEKTKPGAELVYCGKLPDRHLLRQEAINDLLVKYALEGKQVVRLKGGDPSVYGRVGEEAAELDKFNIDYEIVPGITASIGASTYAGVPVTHRDHGASFAIVSGHDKSPEGQPLIDWEGLAKGIDTIAFYMGVKNLPYICEQLLKNGRKKETPVLLVQWGTLGKQKTLKGTLETIAQLVKEQKFSNPAITIVGEVAKLRQTQSWFERQPLFGKHVLFARTSEGKSEIAEELTRLGADVFEYPRFQTKNLDKSQLDLTKYDQIIFHSPKSVEWFFNQLKQDRIDIRTIKSNFFGASKKSIQTIESFACNGLSLKQLREGSKLVIGPLKWGELVDKRNSLYGQHDFVASHKEELVVQSNFTCQRILDEDRVDTIVFPSAESVKAVTEQIKACNETPETLSQRATIICFGPATQEVALSYGYEIHAILEEPSQQSLIEELLKL